MSLTLTSNTVSRLILAGAVTAGAGAVLVDRLVVSSSPASSPTTTSAPSTSSAPAGNGKAPPTTGDCGSGNVFVTYTSGFARSPLGYHVTSANVANLTEKNCNGDTVIVSLGSSASSLTSASVTMGPKDTSATVTFPAPGPLAQQVTLVTVQICNQPNGNGAGQCKTVTP